MASHADLVQYAEKWLYKACGCGFVFTEFHTRCAEIPDAIGFRDGLSILVECKANRADFLSDKKKYFRYSPNQGLGAFRFYMCEKGLITPDELPDKWGLVYVYGDRCRKVVGQKGNTWSTYHNAFYFSERNIRGEHFMMQSALRRLYLRGVLDLIYEPYHVSKKRNKYRRKRKKRK